jgi:hypothetical protein
VTGVRSERKFLEHVDEDEFEESEWTNVVGKGGHCKWFCSPECISAFYTGFEFEEIGEISSSSDLDEG